MVKNNQDIGRLGEKIAASYLISKKYIILDKNYRTRTGEIDIVAKKNKKIVFFEVKTRLGEKLGKPYEAVNYFKLKSLKKTINYYLLQKKLTNCKLSLDVVSIILDDQMNVYKLQHFENIIC